MKKQIIILSIFLISACEPFANPQDTPSPSVSPSITPSPSASPTENPIAETGTLRVKVEIGPLCPVEPCNISDEQKESIYSSRYILIYNQDRSRLIESVQLNKTGIFERKLERGIYILDMAKQGIEKTNLPTQVAIIEDQKVSVNINIDTGIR